MENKPEGFVSTPKKGIVAKSQNRLLLEVHGR